MRPARARLYPLLLAAVTAGAILYPCPALRRAAAAEAHFGAFLDAAARGEWAQAEDHLAAARRAAPRSAYYAGCWGWLQERRAGAGRWTGWASLSRYAVSRDPHRMAAARGAFLEALHLNPDDDAFLHNLAWLDFLAGRPAEARGWLRHALDREHAIALYHVSLGLMAEWDQRLEEAEDSYTEALACAPSLVDSPFFRELGERRREVRQRALARAQGRLRARLALDAGPIARAKLGSLLLFEGDWPRADQALSAAVAELPSLSRGWLNLARLRAASGDRSEAARCWRRAQALDPADPLLLVVPETGASLQEAEAAAANPLSEHAIRAGRLYRARHILRDDVIPQGLLSYCSPGPRRPDPGGGPWLPGRGGG